MYVAPGGEFVFVTFGLAASAGLLSMGVNQINLAVVLTMAMTPLRLTPASCSRPSSRRSLASRLCRPRRVTPTTSAATSSSSPRRRSHDRELLNTEPSLRRSRRQRDAVSEARASDLPVYFGDAGSEAVLHAVGADKASCAVVTLDTPTATFRAALKKNFPTSRCTTGIGYRAGSRVEQAGAKAVVPETLEPSLQLAVAVLSEMEMSNEDISIAVDNFRRSHMGELQILAANSGSALSRPPQICSQSTG